MIQCYNEKEFKTLFFAKWVETNLSVDDKFVLNCIKRV